MTLYWFECRICGYDSDEAKRLARTTTGICPLCASDCGHSNELTYRQATSAEIARLEGRA